MIVPDPPNDPTPSSAPPRKAVLAVGVGLLLMLSVSWWLDLLPFQVGSRGRVGAFREQGGPYAGSRSCRECHPGEYASHSRSGHARTLRPAALVPLARRLDGRVVADPERPGATWSFALRDGGFNVERKESGVVERWIIEYALGSDHHATTFVTLTDPAMPTALEHRLTHYADGDSLGITPGQRAEQPVEGTTLRGRNLGPRETIKCFRCHATQVSASEDPEFDVNELIPNVSCERCHGPAREHVAAARAGRRVPSMPFGLDGWTSGSQMALCGECHRHPSRAPPGLIRPENTSLARFQPVGLMQSKCYTKSGGSLSCVTCHEPHSRASADRAGYESSCLNCHGPDRKAGCPVSPRSGCIDCHMPKVDSGQNVSFTDHWIRVRASPDRPSPPAGPVPQGDMELKNK